MRTLTKRQFGDYIYIVFFLSFQNDACFHGVAHENTLRHNEVTWSEIYIFDFPPRILDCNISTERKSIYF